VQHTATYQGSWGYCKPEGDTSCLSGSSSSSFPSSSSSSLGNPNAALSSPSNKSGSQSNTSSVSRGHNTARGEDGDERKALELELRTFRLLGGDTHATIPLSKLQAGLEKMGEERTVAELLAKAVDTNGDGVTSLHEVVRASRLGMLPGLGAHKKKTLQLILELHDRFAESESDGLSVGKLRRLFVNQVKVSGGMAQVIVNELDVDNSGVLSQAELLRGAIRRLLPLAGGAMQREFKEAAQTYEGFGLAMRVPKLADPVLPGADQVAEVTDQQHTGALAPAGRNETWGLTSPLTPSELKDALSGMGLSKSESMLVMKTTQIDLDTKDTSGRASVPFSSFLSTWTAKLIPQPGTAVDGVKKSLQALGRMFKAMAGNGQSVSADVVAKYLETTGWTAADSEVLSHGMNLELGVSIDLPIFARAYVEGLVVLDVQPNLLPPVPR